MRGNAMPRTCAKRWVCVAQQLRNKNQTIAMPANASPSSSVIEKGLHCFLLDNVINSFWLRKCTRSHTCIFLFYFLYIFPLCTQYIV
uniref:Uncharacterized protein n=1 Tax=Arundo donax TaxID=35708 RepID=A0A0A9HJZ9_ARUDO